MPERAGRHLFPRLCPLPVAARNKNTSSLGGAHGDATVILGTKNRRSCMKRFHSSLLWMLDDAGGSVGAIASLQVGFAVAGQRFAVCVRERESVVAAAALAGW